MVHLKVSLDSEKFTRKPSDTLQYKDKVRGGKIVTESRELGSRVGQIIEHIDLADLSKAIASYGRTFSPFIFDFFDYGQFKRRRRLSHLFLSCQCLCLDFDNGDDLDNLLDICNKHDLIPNIAHETFSSKPEHRKYRLLFALKDQITDAKEAKMKIKTLLDWFPSADGQAKDLSRLFYGSNKGAEIFNGSHLNEIPIPKKIRDSFENSSAMYEGVDCDNGFTFGDEKEQIELNLSTDKEQKRYIRNKLAKELKRILTIDSNSDVSRYQLVFGIAEQLTGTEGLTGWKIHKELLAATQRNSHFDNWNYDPSQVILDAIKWKASTPNIQAGQLFNVKQLKKKKQN